MSLAQHVTQVEGYDYDGRANLKPDDEESAERHDSVPPLPWEPALGIGSDDGKPLSEWRRLSYNPVDTIQDQPEAQERDAAYKVPNWKKCAQVVAAVVACWLASGIVFGFAALKPVLIAEGVYSDLCRDDDEVDLFGHERSDPKIPCARQNMRLNIFFIVASITANIASLLAGATLDRYGRRFCWLASAVLLAIGTLLMAASFSIPEFDGYIAGNIVLALGGTYMFVPSFELANAFPKHSGLVVALVTGAFDASAAVFLFYRIAYEASDGHFSPDKFFFGYLIVPFLILVVELTLMPAHSYHTIPELEDKIEKAQDTTRDVHDSDDEISDDNELTRVRSARADKRMAKLDQLEGVAGDAQEREDRVKLEGERQETSGVWGVLHGVPFQQQVRSPWFVLILLLTLIQMFRMNYFIATIRTQYQYMLGSDDASERINHFFDAALPIGGIATTPFIGILLNNVSVATTMGVLTAFIISIGVFNCLPFAWAGYVTVIFFVIFRPLYYSAISDYAAKVFGFATFGRIYGTVVCISGFSNFAQSGLDALVYGPLHGNPTPINVMLGAAGTCVSAALTIFVAVRGKMFANEKTELEADHERRRLLPENGAGYGTEN